MIKFKICVIYKTNTFFYFIFLHKLLFLVIRIKKVFFEKNVYYFLLTILNHIPFVRNIFIYYSSINVKPILTQILGTSINM